MWLITLIILAIVAFFIVKYVKSQSQRQAAEKERLGQSTGIEGTLEHERPHSAQSSSNAHRNATGSTGSGAVSTPTGQSAGAAGTAGRSVAAGGGAGAAAGAGAVAAGVGAVAAAGAAATAAGVRSATGAASGTGLALDTGDVVGDIREMIKILNLAEPDARRLSITPEQLRALRNADAQGMPDANALNEVASRLRKMLA